MVDNIFLRRLAFLLGVDYIDICICTLKQINEMIKSVTLYEW